MIWLDYTVHSFGNGDFTVEGDWPGEVMGWDKDGNPGFKSRPLYSPGDVFIVDANGVLRKQEDVTKLIYAYDAKKNSTSKSR
jgi:hypothetical protein